MQRNGKNWEKYKKVCQWIAEKRADFCCEVLVEGKRCGKKFVPENISPINFLHRETRNGKSDEWILNPNSIIFGCSSHHIEEEQTGKRVESVTYEEGELTYVPDEQ